MPSLDTTSVWAVYLDPEGYFAAPDTGPSTPTSPFVASRQSRVSAGLTRSIAERLASRYEHNRQERLDLDDADGLL